MPMLAAFASPASSIRLASDNARVMEERGIVLLAFLDPDSNRLGPGPRLRYGRLSGHGINTSDFIAGYLPPASPHPLSRPQLGDARRHGRTAHPEAQERKLLSR